MDVDSAEVAIRPRNHWQAMDLGFLMARHWFLRLWILWMTGAVPLCLLLGLVLSRHWAILVFIVWWFKPVFELPQLYFLSRAIFGDAPTLRSVVTNYYSIVRQIAPGLLIWRRFSFTRSFENPALMLEGLTGNASRDRLRLLKEEAGEKCQWLTFACYHFEILLYFSLITLGAYLAPRGHGEPVLLGVLKPDSWVAELITPVAYTIAMSVVAPFYTAAGFGVYLSRRTLLECWDIELSFKRLATRLAASRAARAMAVVLLCFIVVALPHGAQAETPAKVRAVVKAVAAQKDFGKVESHYTWRLRKTPPPPDKHSFIDRLFRQLGKAFEWIAQVLSSISPLLEALAWFSIIVIILMLVRRFEPWRRWQDLQRRRGGTDRRKPVQVMGLDLSDDSLPADIVAEVQQLLRRAELRAALSLLYRGTLWRLVNRRGLQIDESSTEGECVTLVQRTCPEAEADYFRQLTQCWCRLAYAHEPPAPAQLEDLSTQWAKYYEASHD